MHLINKTSILKAFLTATCSVLFAFASWGADTVLLPQPPTIQKKHFINDAIQLSITPRGMRYFESGLTDLFSSQGLSLSEGYFPGFSWNSDRSYRIDDLGLSKEQRDLLTTVSNLLTKWLVGFTFNEFRPSIQVGDLAYVAHFNRFALVADEALLRRMGKQDGAVLAIELEIRDMTAVTESLLASDQNNQLFGQIGAQAVSVKVGSEQNPMKVRLPFYVRVNEKQELEFQAVEVDSNIDTVDLDVKYKKLVVPQIAIEINGHRFELNQEQLEAETRNQLPKILLQAKGFLKDFATKQLPDLLNEKAKQLLVGSLEEYNRMDPVGAERNPCLPAPVQFTWGMKVTGINMKNSLNLALGAFVEDPLTPDLSINPALNARSKPNLAPVPNDSYDIALTIDRGFINRMLQLSFNRHIFDNMAMDKTDPNSARMDLTMQPELDFAPAPVGAPTGPDMTYLRMKTKARVHKGFLTGFIQHLALNEPFEVRLDVIVRMNKQPNGDILLFYYGIDPTTVSIDKQYIQFPASLFPDTVRAQAIAALEKVAQKWRATNASVSAEPLPIPKEISGIRLDAQKISFDSTGNLLLFMNYAKPGSAVAPTPTKPPVQCGQRGGK